MMNPARTFKACLITAVLYFAAILYSILVSRYEGGIAMIWLGGAVLAARLAVTTRQQWPLTIAVCIVANVIATGVFGLGWYPALPIAIINAAEAIGAALVLRWVMDNCWPNDAVELVAAYYLGLGLIVPMLAATAGAVLLPLVMPLPFAHSFFHWFIGHAVGLLLLSPLAVTISKALTGGQPLIRAGEGIAVMLLLLTMGLLGYAVFNQPELSLLILPIGFAMFVGITADIGVASAMPVLLACVGGGLTYVGKGPFHSLDLPVGDRMQLFVLYATFSTLCTLPLTCIREARRRKALPVVRWASAMGRAAG